MKGRFLLAALVIWLLMAQTAAGFLPDAEDRLQTIVGRLYLNYKSLDNIYKDLHEASFDAVGGSDRQLSYIQKAYVFVNEANLICFYQWELLGVIEYIKDERRSDYFTLRVKDLGRSIFESRDRMNSLMLYHAYIEDDAARKKIDEALGIIEANIYIYEEIRDILRPHANPPNPFNPNF
ncbi:MAG: hypothetical protein JSW26_09435 [Desulfobacterales bacterium]|nr:MAG: hypothetical protein JSW26_09435 [Desulfobacterales bacterium]